jgi:two-component system response regulator RstA
VSGLESDPRRSDPGAPRQSSVQSSRRGGAVGAVLSRSRDGASELHLTSLEQSLLYLLAANAGRVVSRGEILDALSGVDYVAESNVVDRRIHNLARPRDDWQHALRGLGSFHRHRI